MEDKEIRVGTIIHYYDKINVAIVLLENDLKLGDKIKLIRGGEDLFEQIVDSLEVDHHPIEKAIKGQEAGIKLIAHAKEGAEVYKF